MNIKVIRDGRWTFKAYVVKATSTQVRIDVTADLPGLEQSWNYAYNGRQLRLISVSYPGGTEIEYPWSSLKKPLAAMASEAHRKQLTG